MTVEDPPTATPTPISSEVQAVAASQAFGELVRRRSVFVRNALIASAVWFGTFILLTAYAHSFMGTFIAPGLTVAYVLGLSQFGMVWIVTAAYLRTSTRTFAPLEASALEAISSGKD
ncbi:DUF485 domain-containing protein [Rhodococcus sp. IEGM 1307]|jgi:uncharacterized membrane protein (DUF485 family)|uniref:DUF485 domain-containing protein n=1 Tax=Rhodococcus sp. IEGM 1307 TaxID=3047091 RepID=UPI0024B8538C|nr:DUF485 domain-containing protein [Rhodococcus sp. IEGM 1307]MDI9978870.1 DUF485 domain-containing protein [Rhodococcus sp. IEGM 1307]